MPSGVNLIPMTRTLARRRRVRVRRWVAACASYAAALSVAWAAMHLASGDEHLALADELASLDRQIEEDRLASAALRPRLASAMATIEASRSVGNQPDWSLLLTLLAQFLGDDAVLSSCELSQEQPAPPSGQAYKLRLGGIGRSHGAVLGYVRKLEDCGLFRAVTLIETRPEPFGDKSAVGFSIECSLADEPGEGG